MASKVDICNMALSVLGDVATVTSIDPPDGSAQADHCLRFYSQAVMELIASHNWSFATRRAKLNAMAAVPLGVIPGEKAFVLPADCQKIVSVASADIMPYRNIKFRKEFFEDHEVVVTRAPSILLTYITSEIQDGLLPPTFVTALIHRLAAYLAGPLVPGSSGAELASKQLELYQMYLNRAIKFDAQQRFEKESYRSPFLGDNLMEPDYAVY